MSFRKKVESLMNEPGKGTGLWLGIISLTAIFTLLYDKLDGEFFDESLYSYLGGGVVSFVLATLLVNELIIREVEKRMREKGD